MRSTERIYGSLAAGYFAGAQYAAARYLRYAGESLLDIAHRICSEAEWDDYRKLVKQIEAHPGL